MMSNRINFVLRAIFLCLTLTVLMASSATASNDPLVQRWIQEQDQAAVKMLQGWAAGVPMEELVEYGVVILSSTMNIQARCRNDIVFLKRSLVLFAAGPNTQIEEIPSLIFEKKIKRPGFFSTESIFTEEK